MQKHLIFDEFKDLKKVVNLLHASVKKFKPYKTKKIYTPDELEYYDSLSFRFKKAVELMLIFFKSQEFYTQAKTSDTLRDRLLMMQKIGLVDDIVFWLQARLL